MAANRKYRHLYVVWAFVENLLLTGSFFGWGSLVFILKEDGVYSDLCPPETWATTTAMTATELWNASSIGTGTSTTGVEQSITAGESVCCVHI